MKHKLLEFSLLQNIHNDKETDTAKENQSAGGQIQQDILLIRDQISQSAQNIKSRIVKRRNGMEYTDSKGMKCRIILTEYDKA